MSEWISVGERLPSLDQPVLLSLGGHVQHVAYSRQHCPEGWDEDLTDADFWLVMVGVDGDEAMPLHEPTHWMPLPDPPK